MYCVDNNVANEDKPYLSAVRSIPTKRNWSMKEIEREVRFIPNSMIGRREMDIELEIVQPDGLLGLIIGSNVKD